MTIGTLCFKKSCHNSVPSPMRPNELWTCPDDGTARAQAPGCQRSSCRSVRRGRGGDWCRHDEDKAKDEDLDTPGYLRGDRVRLGRWRSRIVGASPLARSR